MFSGKPIEQKEKGGMKRSLPTINCLILTACLCILICSVSFADEMPAVYSLNCSSVQLNPVSGNLLIDNGNQYQVFTPDGKTALSEKYPDASVDNGFFKVRTENGLNSLGMLDGYGEEMIPPEYGRIEIISDRWQAGIVLKPATAENYDYRSADDSFCIIDRVDVYFRGKLRGALDRTDWKDATASGDFLEVRDRNERTVWYDCDLHQSPVAGDSYSEYIFDYESKLVIHAGSGQKAFTGECTLQDDQVSAPLYYRDGEIVDLQGNVLCHPVNCRPENIFNKGRYILVKNSSGKYGFIDLTGKQIVSCVYDSIERFSESYELTGYAYAVREGKGGFVNLRTGERTGFDYDDSVCNIYAGFLAVEDLNGNYIVTCAGTGKLPGTYTGIMMDHLYFSSANPTAILFDAEGRCGVVNYLGEWLIPMSSDYEPVLGIYASQSVSYDGTVILARKSMTERYGYTYSSYVFRQDFDAGKEDDGSEKAFVESTESVIEVTPAPEGSVASMDAPDPDKTAGTWTCENGHEGNSGKFCGECGAPEPTPTPAPTETAETWICENGHEGNTGKFCAECGAAKPTPAPIPAETGETWTCENGHEGNTGKFCAECGAPRPLEEEKTWTCENGHEGNTGKFCAECGAPKP